MSVLLWARELALALVMDDVDEDDVDRVLGFWVVSEYGVWVGFGFLLGVVDGDDIVVVPPV